jgi:outer membrane beta-barrel protein
VESRLRVLLLALALLTPAVAGAEDEPPVIEPRLARPVLDLAAIDSENFELTAFAGLLSLEDFGVNAVYGARLAYHIGERLFVEAGYGVSEAGETSFETLSGGIQLLTDEQRELSYYNLSLGFNVLPAEAFPTRQRALASAIYLVGGIGSTEFAGSERFTLHWGLGYRLLANDWLALHVDFRDHVFDIDLLGEDKTTHNFEISAGISAFF